MASIPEHHDVLVIGAGPSGAACAYWLAEAGWDVAVVERKHFPREKTCGDGLTPRAVRQLEDMGLGAGLDNAHRYDGLRACAFGSVLELPWPSHPSFPAYGYVITRHDLDQMVAEHAVKAGATLYQGVEAVSPLFADKASDAEPARAGAAGGAGGAGGAGAAGNVFRDGGRLPPCTGATVRDKESGQVRDIRARIVVVADGANSRFGRSLGTARNTSYPMGMALRGYFRSDRHEERFIESHLDIRDKSGAVVPGYGWIFPLGDGRVNVGVGVLSSAERWKGTNTSRLMDAFVDFAPRSWGLSDKSSCGAPTGGRLPMGLAVGPRTGPTTLLVGDASGSINPFNGEGIAYGYETGRLAASCVGRALAGEGGSALADYETRLQDAYGLYYKVARVFVKIINEPRLMRACVSTGMRSESAMGWLLRIMANLVRPDERGPAEIAYRSLVALARTLPDA
jgi:geranylgeranyl reductase family protein